MKRFWFDDLGLKLAALLLACALWLYVGTNQVLERRVDLKVIFTDLPANASLSSEVQSTVPVVLVGRKERVGSFDPREMKAVASLQSVPVPSRDYPVKIQVSNIPKGVALDVPPLLVTLTNIKGVPTPMPSKKNVRSSNRKR